jgi:nucleoside-diphosphate-sugar epimerase
MKVLLTGSTGFLGGYLLAHLNSFELVPYNRKKSDKVEWKNLHGVIHCAGLAHNSHDKKLKDLYYKANVQLTKELIDHFTDSPANFFIFISTSTIYENTCDENDVDESNIGKDLSIYAESKLQAEQELLRIINKKIFILRPSVIVGPNAKGNIRLLQKLVYSRLPIPIPYKSSINNLTDIRNLTKVIEFIGTNYSKLESGVYNVNDNLRPNIEEILRNIANQEGFKIKFIKVHNQVFLFGLKIISYFKPEISKKLNSLFFDSLKISNLKISKIVDLDYNSFQ